MEKHKTLITKVLYVFIIGLFSFVGLYGAFSIKKEIACSQSMYSEGCYLTYQQFIANPFLALHPASF